MIFVTGPLFAGKEDYIKNALKLTDEEFRACAVRDVQALAANADDLTALADKLGAFRACAVRDVQELAASADDLTALADKLGAFRVVIATEVGGGVVPTDERQRQSREAAGRLACLLAQRADTVVRVCCGLPQVLKGKIPTD